MTKTIFCVLLLLCIEPTSTFAQSATGTSTQPATGPVSPHKIAYDTSQGPGGDLGAVAALEKVEDQFTGRDRDEWMDALATRLIFLGDHRKAMELNSKAYSNARGKSGDSNGSELKGYHPTPAIETIVTLAKDRRVLMLNEEHRSSRERAFGNELLQPLHDAGFTHLALETIGGDMDELGKRKYPIIKNGFYTRDPILGDLVRRATEMGMGIVQYEADMTSLPADLDRSDPLATTNWRERKQAENLDAFLKAHPDARVIVWSGRHHMSEDEVPGGDVGKGQWTPMGGIFKKISDIDPLTVDLMVLNEMKTPENEHKTYRWVVDHEKIGQPTVFLDEKGKPWSPLPSLDVGVFFPRTKWVHDRPEWLKMHGLRVGFMFDWSQATDKKPAPGRPLVVEARVQGESDDAIPMDRIIWREGESPPIFARPGKSYKLVLRDPEGNVLADRSMQLNAPGAGAK